MTPRKLPRRTHVAFVGLLALAMISFGALDIRKPLAVLRSQSVATARVVEFRTRLTKWRETLYEVRYVFSPAVGSPEIGRTDFLDRSDLWAELPEQDWRVAVASKQLQVRFDPDDPTNNAPVASPPNIWDSIAPIIIGSLLAVGVVAIERKRRKQQSV